MQRRVLSGRRPLMISIGAVVAAAVVGAIVWLPRGGDRDADTTVAATLTAIRAEETSGYVYPDWWTDGSTPLRLTASGDGLVVDSPLDWSQLVNGEHVLAPLSAPSGAKPASVAALPGSGGAPWVAVAFENVQVELDDKSTTERPLTWTGTTAEDNSEQVPAKPVTLPVDLRSNQVSSVDESGIMTARAAVARLGEVDIALVTTSQRGVTTLHACEIEACEWRKITQPAEEDDITIASTADGFIAMTGKPADGQRFWFANNTDFEWREAGSLPKGTSAYNIRDGEQAVTFLAEQGSDDERTATVYTASAAGVEAVTETGTLVNGTPRTEPVEVNGTWHIGGYANSDMRIDVGDGHATEAALWALEGDAWQPINDELLRNQPGQWMQLLYADVNGALSGVSTSPFRSTLTWRFDAVDTGER